MDRRTKQIPVLACIPVDWCRLKDAQRIALLKTGAIQGLPNYAGSRKIPCDQCGDEVFIGPRQFDILPIPVVCFACVPKGAPVVHLGNTSDLKKKA